MQGSLWCIPCIFLEHKLLYLVTNENLTRINLVLPSDKYSLLVCYYIWQRNSRKHLMKLTKEMLIITWKIPWCDHQMMIIFDDWKLHWNMNSSHIFIVQYKAVKPCSWDVLKQLCVLLFIFLLWLYLLVVDTLINCRVKNMPDQKVEWFCLES